MCPSSGCVWFLQKERVWTLSKRGMQATEIIYFVRLTFLPLIYKKIYNWTDLPPERVGGAFLPSVDSVPTLPRFAPWRCALHQVQTKLFIHISNQNEALSFIGCMILTLSMPTVLQPRLPDLLHEEEGSEGSGWPEQAGVSIRMVIKNWKQSWTLTLFICCILLCKNTCDNFSCFVWIHFFVVPFCKIKPNLF